MAKREITNGTFKRLGALVGTLKTPGDTTRTEPEREIGLRLVIDNLQKILILDYSQQ